MDQFIKKLELLSKQYWYVLIIGIGILLILGAIFKWKWVLERQGDRPFGFMSWVYNLFGETGYRIVMAILGVFLIIFAIVYAAMLGQVNK